jgi:hypothetical protein
MSRLDIREAQDLYKSVDSLRRTKTLNPDILADFIYNRRNKLVGKLNGFAEVWKDFDACEVQFRSLIDLDAYRHFEKNPTSDEVNFDDAKEIAEVAELAFAIFVTWKWTHEKK